MFRNIFYFFRAVFTNFNNKKIKVRLSTRIRNRHSFDGYNKIGKRTYIKGHIGAYTYIGDDCTIYGTVGKFTSISNNVRVIPALHPVDLVSTSPCFYSKAKQNNVSFYKNDKEYIDEKMVTIGNDVWIGDTVLIKGGVTIGDGAIIGMGSVVTKDVEPYTIVGGAPAKVIRKRFDDDTIKKLHKSQWWNKDFDYYKNNSELFLNVDQFKEMFK